MFNRKTKQQDSEYRRKKMIMALSISGIMLVIFIIWLGNLGSIMEAAQRKIDRQGSNVNLGEMKEEFNEALGNLTDNINKLKEDEESVSESAPQEELASSTAELKALQERIDELEKSLKAQPQSPKSTCPAWINCMPGPDFDGVCQIPLGCEGITQIAY